MSSTPIQNQTIHTHSKSEDRRRFTRFTPKNGTMAVNDHTLGPIVNISMGGLSFQCMDNDNHNPMSDLFGIFLGSDDILIERIQSQIVSNRLKVPENTFMQTKTRQLSVQFLNLSSVQQKRLNDFILTKTRGVVSAD